MKFEVCYRDILQSAYKWEFYQIYNLDVLGHKNELVTWSQKVDQCHSKGIPINSSPWKPSGYPVTLTLTLCPSYTNLTWPLWRCAIVPAVTEMTQHGVSGQELHKWTANHLEILKRGRGAGQWNVAWEAYRESRREREAMWSCMRTNAWRCECMIALYIK